MIKLLVVDDSALMRKLIVQIFSAEGDFDIRIARDGEDALAQAHEFRPDVITLDVNMPRMDGLTCLSRIMAEAPCPVVMVSSLTEKGALATFEAMSLGAVDYIPKPDGTISMNIDKISEMLVEKIRTAARAKLRRAKGLASRIREQNLRAQLTRGQDKGQPGKRLGVRAKAPLAADVGTGLVLMGVSTGGPGALEELLPALPANFPWPVAVVQHMPASFTGFFTTRMNGICALEVVEVVRPMPIEPGRIYIARGDADMTVGQRTDSMMLMPRPAAEQYLWHPSVDCLVASALEHYPPAALVGVLLTGMGYDGAESMTRLRASGGRTIAQDEETSVVYGMPMELAKRGGADVVLPLEKIARQLRAWVK